MKVGLYIPCFNTEATIQSCLEAVFKQTYPIKEVVVVDDGSTDRSIEIASKYPVRIIRHTNNKGLASARNTAIKNIDAEFIASIDADCQPESDWLSCLLKRFDSTNMAGVGGRLLENYSSNIFDLWRSVHMKQYWEEEKISPPFLFGSNAVFSKKALINAGLYKENFKSNYEDVEICGRLRKAGYSLVYEPKARAHHLKRDNIKSLLDNYWRWNLHYYQEKDSYSSQNNFLFKVKDNIGLANRYMENDIKEKRFRLLYLDFLLAIHHSLRDLEYFFFQNNLVESDKPTILSLWLSLLDLTFFCHFNSGEDNLSTLIPKRNSFFQNFIALNLILGRVIENGFKSDKFKRTLYKHLFLSVYKLHDELLLDKLLNLIKAHYDWDDIFKKNQPNLDSSFLKNISLNFNNWLGVLTYRFPEIITLLENSAEEADTDFN